MSSRPTWHSPQVLATLFLIFLTGAGFGFFIGRYGMREAYAKNVAVWKDADRAQALHRFKRELKLTPEQAKQFEVVLDDFMMYMQTLQAQMDDVRAQGKDRILQILNEEQRGKFKRMVSELQTKLH